MSLGFFGNASSFPGSHLGPSRFLVRFRHPTSCCPVKPWGSPSQFGSPHFVLISCIMPSDAVNRPLTLITFLPEDIHKKVHHEDIVAKLLSKLDVSDVSCIQFMPNGYVRLTFTSMEARSDAFLSGVFYDTLRLRVFEAQSSVYNVYVHHLPFEVPDRDLEEVLSAFGVVHGITEQTHPGSPVYNGSRVVKMTVTSAIPANLRVLRYPCRMFYKDQPMSCFICKKSHRASNCPLRDVCRRCRQPGHFAKDCSDVSESAPAAPAPAPAAPPPAPAVPPPAPAAPPSAPVAPSSAPVPSDDDPDDPDYVPDDAEMSAASSEWVDENLPSRDDEVASQASSVPPSRLSPISVPGSPAPKSARVRGRRRKFKLKPNVATARPRKSPKSVPADPPPAQPSVSRDSAKPSPVPDHPPVQSSDDEPVPIFPEYPFSVYDFPPCLPPLVEGPESPSEDAYRDPNFRAVMGDY